MRRAPIADRGGYTERTRLVDDDQVHAAAGVTMALGAVAFAYANFEHTFWLIRTVTPLGTRRASTSSSG